MTNLDPIVLPTGRVGGAYPKQALDVACPRQAEAGHAASLRDTACVVCGGIGWLPNEAGRALLDFMNRHYRKYRIGPPPDERPTGI